MVLSPSCPGYRGVFIKLAALQTLYDWDFYGLYPAGVTNY